MNTFGHVGRFARDIKAGYNACARSADWFTTASWVDLNELTQRSAREFLHSAQNPYRDERGEPVAYRMPLTDRAIDRRMAPLFADGSLREEMKMTVPFYWGVRLYHIAHQTTVDQARQRANRLESMSDVALERAQS